MVSPPCHVPPEAQLASQSQLPEIERPRSCFGALSCGRCGFSDLVRCSGPLAGPVSSLPDTDLFCFPMVPPVEPGWAAAACTDNNRAIRTAFPSPRRVFRRSSCMISISGSLQTVPQPQALVRRLDALRAIGANRRDDTAFPGLLPAIGERIVPGFLEGVARDDGQLAPEWAKTPHSVPKKLISTGHELAPQDCWAAATAALRVSCDHAIPQLPLLLE